MPHRPPDTRTKAERRRDAIYGERPALGVPLANPRSLQLGAQGYFEGDCTRCLKELKREQPIGAVRHVRSTDGKFAIRFRHGYLCAACSDEIAAELGGAWWCSWCGGVGGPEHAQYHAHWTSGLAVVTWQPFAAAADSGVGTPIPIINRHHG